MLAPTDMFIDEVDFSSTQVFPGQVGKEIFLSIYFRVVQHKLVVGTC